MKHFFLSILLLGTTCIVVSQEPLRNFGNLKIHSSGSIGFHYNLINTGTFNDNLGLVGFFNDSSELNILGSEQPVFYDMEVFVDDNLNFDVSVGITNNLNFISGDINTPRNLAAINLDFTDSSFYSGQDNLRKVDGYVSVSNVQSFIFPVGDDDELRPLLFEAEVPIVDAQSAYFKENPEFSISLNNAFPITEKDDAIVAVSSQEFWKLKSLDSVNITLSWNTSSAIEDITDNIENLVVVGWNTSIAQWNTLGAITVNGNLEEGFVKSLPFIPNEYEIITFGSIAEPQEKTVAKDYIISPNGDGNNDFLVIKDIPPNNILQIYNRYGALVFKQENYVNEFNGVSSNRLTIGKGNALPTAVYFYVVTDTDTDERFQGFLYLAAE